MFKIPKFEKKRQKCRKIFNEDEFGDDVKRLKRLMVK